LGDCGGGHSLRRRFAVARGRGDGGEFRGGVRFRPLERLLPKSRWAPSSLRVIYEDGRGVLREILIVCTHEEFAVTGVEVERGGGFDRRGKHTGKARAKEAADAATGPLEEGGRSVSASKPAVTVALELRGGRSIARLVDKLSEIDRVFAVTPGDAGLIGD
jgi:putative Mg2+ transporter-C (MgtC) family protein